MSIPFHVLRVLERLTLSGNKTGQGSLRITITLNTQTTGRTVIKRPVFIGTSYFLLGRREVGKIGARPSTARSSCFVDYGLGVAFNLFFLTENDKDYTSPPAGVPSLPSHRGF